MAYAPIKNEIFHVHTWRCGHAGNETEEEYVRKAVELGASRIAFTDHAPFPDNPFGNRMGIEELPGYLETINGLKETFSGTIEVLCGLEVEWLPSYAKHIEALRATDGIDLLIIGQHMFETDVFQYSYEDTDKTLEFEGLFQAMTEGAKTGLFDVVAHSDRAYRRRRTFGDAERESAQTLIETAIANNVILEKNYASMTQKYHYWTEFWDIVPPSAPTNFGADAHSVAAMEAAWRYRLFNR